MAKRGQQSKPSQDKEKNEKIVFVVDPGNLTPEITVWGTFLGLEFLLKAISRDDRRRIDYEAERYIAEQKITDPLEVKKIMDQFYCDELIADWKGVVTPDGKPAPLTREVKYAVFAAIPNFDQWAGATTGAALRKYHIRKENELGNSASSPRGSQTAPGEQTEPN